MDEQHSHDTAGGRLYPTPREIKERLGITPYVPPLRLSREEQEERIDRALQALWPPQEMRTRGPADRSTASITLWVEEGRKTLADFANHYRIGHEREREDYAHDCRLLLSRQLAPDARAVIQAFHTELVAPSIPAGWVSALDPSAQQIQGVAVNAPVPTLTVTPSDPGKAVEWLMGWEDICPVLHRKVADRQFRVRVMQLNKNTGGPIVPAGKRGGQVKVVKADLISWWNSLQERLAALAAQTEQAALDRKLAVEANHPYGRTGTVAPGVNGGVKERRKPG